MKSRQELERTLKKIDHKSYGAYKSLGGSYDFGNYLLHIDHVQGDPFASPSRMRLEVKREMHKFPEEYCRDLHRRLALEDQVLRRFQKMLKVNIGENPGRGDLGQRAEMDHRRPGGRMGSGKSGRITSLIPGQTVLPGIAVLFGKKSVELRFEMGFPARGRTILAREMEKLLFEIIPHLAKEVLFYPNWEKRSQEKLKKAIDLADDQLAIRNELEKRGLIAFVADGSILPRESGVSDLPMRDALPFTSPKSVQIEMTLPHKGKITGMGIPEGITVIVGGGYHGKSTLLKALEQGVYNHIAGDGREYVIARADGVKIRAEDGRSVKHTDISLFIKDIPGGSDTMDFSSENASGSTSQAANLIEALEAESRLLFLDEDTSATNFMIRDGVMARLVSDDKEPITTLLKHIRGLYHQLGVSFVIVVGSSGDYLSVADLVLQMDHYHVKDVTIQAKKICQEMGVEELYKEEEEHWPDFSRTLLPAKPGRMKLKAMGTDTVSIDKEPIDVRYLEQLTGSGQTVGLAYLMGYLLTHVKSPENIAKVIDNIYDGIERKGLMEYIPDGYNSGQPQLPRKQETYFCLNRYRKAKIKR